MNDTTRQAIFDELMEASGTRIQQEHHFTIRDFAESQHLKHDRAGRILEELRERGIVDRERILTNTGRQGWGYWKL